MLDLFICDSNGHAERALFHNHGALDPFVQHVLYHKRSPTVRLSVGVVTANNIPGGLICVLEVRLGNGFVRSNMSFHHVIMSSEE